MTCVAGFNYAYRRTATPTTVATPNSATSSLPAVQPNVTAKPPTNNRPIPPHMSNRSDASTPPAKDPAKDASSPKVNGAPSTPVSNDKAEKEKQKRKEKKERKEREKAERDAKEA